MARCALTNELPLEPILSVKSGLIFEKRAILQHLEGSTKCPVTEEELTLDDLVELKVPKTVPPRAATATSVPGLVSLVQSEWDELMLETHTLKKHLEATREELSQTLYQNDAACRVIARLAGERDEARAQLERHHANVAAAEEAAAAAAAEAAAAAALEESGAVTEASFTEEILEKMQATFAELSKTRKKRAPPADLPPPEALREYRESFSQTLHKTNPPGVTTLAVHPAKRHILLTGGADKTCVVFDAASGRQLGVCQGHTKRVRAVAWHQTDMLAVSGAADKTCRVWRAEPSAADSGGYDSVAQFKGHHTGEVVGVAMQPTGLYFASAGADGTYALYDIERQKCFKLAPNAAEGPLSSVAFHPDGLIMCTGVADGRALLWDLKQKGACVATLQGGGEACGAVAFSENGYTMATGSDDGFLKLWDLRKVKQLARLPVGSKLAALSFERSGAYLAAVGASDVRVFSTGKDPLLLTEYPRSAKPMTGVGWGPSGRWLLVSSMDRTVRCFGDKPTPQ